MEHNNKTYFDKYRPSQTENESYAILTLHETKQDNQRQNIYQGRRNTSFIGDDEETGIDWGVDHLIKRVIEIAKDKWVSYFLFKMIYINVDIRKHLSIYNFK